MAGFPKVYRNEAPHSRAKGYLKALRKSEQMKKVQEIK
jgi:hypothetical protein